MFKTTICALATARMNCAIHIIRISGPLAYEIVNKISSKKIKKQSFKIVLTNIIEQDNVIDNVLINCFMAPNSYTGEDVLEINCHGGVFIADTIINLLVKHGCVLAQRGEFTKRAMLNKKIDLSQTEAVNNLIHAQNKYAMKGAIKALLGTTSETITQVRQNIFMLIGQIEVNIDYPEYQDIEQVNLVQARKITTESLKTLTNLLINSKRFIPLNDGIKVVIIGAPNAGKSTLLNALSSCEKAIVSDIPGTTRDIVESTIIIDDITLKLYDTAGIRQTNNMIEQQGIEKAKQCLEDADLVLLLKPVNTIQDIQLWEQNLIENKKHIIVFTKSDLLTSDLTLKDNEVLISAKNNQIELLLTKIKHLFEVEEFDNSDMNVLQSIYQINLLESIIYTLKLALEKLDSDPLDLIIEFYNDALNKLNQILGLDANYDFMDELFKNFCIGK